MLFDFINFSVGIVKIDKQEKVKFNFDMMVFFKILMSKFVLSGGIGCWIFLLDMLCFFMSINFFVYIGFDVEQDVEKKVIFSYFSVSEEFMDFLDKSIVLLVFIKMG